MNDKYTVKTVSEKMGIPEQALRVAMQQKRIDFGFCKQKNGRYSYYFIPHLTAKALGDK